MKNKNGLTKQQQGFCNSYRSDPELNATRAYLKNYKVKSDKVAQVAASRLLSNVMVQKYLAEKHEIAELKADYDQEQWVRDMLEIKDICMGHKPITLYTEVPDKEGKPKRIEVSHLEFNPAAAIKSLETMAKFKQWIASEKPAEQSVKAVQNNYRINFYAVPIDD